MYFLLQFVRLTMALDRLLHLTPQAGEKPLTSIVFDELKVLKAARRIKPKSQWATHAAPQMAAQSYL
jgi:hypothetical protein